MFEREAKREKILESRMKEIRLKEKQLQQDHGDGDNNADGVKQPPKTPPHPCQRPPDP